MSDMESHDFLPKIALDFIDAVVKKVRYRKKIRQEVREELTDHFYMVLKDCTTDEEKQQVAEEVIDEFGDIRMLASLIRRGKKRCRSLWRTVVLRTFQALGLLILLMVLYSAWFVAGNPSIETDYVEALNKHLRPEVDDENNAAVNYSKASELYQKLSRDDDFYEVDSNYELYPRGLSVQQREGLDKWLKSNEKAWAEFSIASGKPYFYKDYGNDDRRDDIWLMNINLENLGEVKGLSKLTIWKSRMAIEEGNVNEAIDNCVMLYKVSKHWMSQGTLIEYLVGVSVGSMANMEVFYLAGDGRLGINELKTLQDKMAAVFPDGYKLCDLTGEEMSMLDVIQHYFTDGGPGGGHVAPRALAEYFFGDYYELDEVRDFLFGMVIHAGRDKTVEKAKDLFSKINRLAKMTPYARHVENLQINDVIKETSRYRYYVLHVFIPAFEKLIDYKYYMSGCHYEAAQAVLAIKQWQAQNGALPGSLDALVEGGMLEKLPDDPYSAGSLVYRVEGGDFTLYSVGQNFIDDGGVRRTKVWDKDGDTIFWPVVK